MQVKHGVAFGSACVVMCIVLISGTATYMKVERLMSKGIGR